jgi:SAM-dependent methyltransferase
LALHQRGFPHLEDLRRAYDGDANHRNGIQDLQWRPGVLESWLKELPSAPRLLELGPGTGQLASYAKGLGAVVHAIDLSAANVAYCRQRGISAEVGDFRALGQLDHLGLFDGIYSINALLHVPRAEHASVIAGARSRLVPGGCLLLVNWGGRDMEGIWADDSCDPPRFFSHYDDASFSDLAFEGFQVVRRELLSVHTPDGLHPQLLAVRQVTIPGGQQL